MKKGFTRFTVSFDKARQLSGLEGKLLLKQDPDRTVIIQLSKIKITKEMTGKRKSREVYYVESITAHIYNTLEKAFYLLSDDYVEHFVSLNLQRFRNDWLQMRIQLEAFGFGSNKNS